MDALQRNEDRENSIVRANSLWQARRVKIDYGGISANAFLFQRLRIIPRRRQFPIKTVPRNRRAWTA